MTNTPLWAIGLVFLCAILGALGQLLFKLGSETISLNLLSWITNWQFLLGIFLYGVSTILFVWALRFGNLSILYPIIATSYIWVALLSVMVLGEEFTLVKWLGITMILGGVSLVIR